MARTAGSCQLRPDQRPTARLSPLLRRRLVLVFVERDHLGSANRAEDSTALRPLVQGGALLGVRQGRAAVLAAVGKLLDSPLLKLHLPKPSRPTGFAIRSRPRAAAP